LAGQKTVELDLEAVGFLYRVTPATLKKLAEAAPLLGTLVREPDNLHDENAIAVYVNEAPWSNFHVGYLRREVAAEFAPYMDNGALSFDEVWLQSVDVDEGKGEILVRGTKRKSLQKKVI
jgi:hypothetical protein